MGRQQETKIERQQTQKQMPVKVVQGVPSKAEIANMNTKSIIFDEVNLVLYVKGNSKSAKFQGVTV